MKKVLFIASTGGHFNELMQLRTIFENYDYYIITEKDKSTENMKNLYGKRISFLLYGTRKKFLVYSFKFIFNFFKSFYLYIKIKPQFIVTTGTHTAVPMCYIGKLLGAKIIFIETFANQKTKTLSGKLVYPISDLFIVQWEELQKLYPKSVLGGTIY